MSRTCSICLSKTGKYTPLFYSDDNGNKWEESGLLKLIEKNRGIRVMKKNKSIPMICNSCIITTLSANQDDNINYDDDKHQINFVASEELPVLLSSTSPKKSSQNNIDESIKLVEQSSKSTTIVSNAHIEKLQLENQKIDEKENVEISSGNNINKKRINYLDWNEYFMALVFLSSQRSKDPCTQVGACIVDKEKRIIAVGYNGMPRGCNDDEFPWGKSEKNLKNKHLYVCHAEVNAILNKNSYDVKNCIMYVGLFPCNECAKIIIQSGIKTVIYMSDKHAHKIQTQAAKIMFKAAHIKYYQYLPKNSKIIINFNEINWNEQSQMPVTPAKNC